MPRQRGPQGATDGRRSALTTGALVVLLAVLGDLLGPGLGLASVAEMAALCAYIAVLCAAVLLYVPWRIGRSQTTAWLVTAVAAFALQGMHWFMLLLGDAARPDDQVAWIAVYQIVATLGLCLLVTRSERLRVRQDPLVTGFLLGLVVIAGRGFLLELPLSAPSNGASTAIIVGLTLIGALNAVELVRFHGLSPWLRNRLGVASVLLGLGQATAAFPEQGPAGLSVVSIVTNVLGAAVLTTTSFLLARRSIQEEDAALEVLQSRLQKAELGQQGEQARLHELRATVAGLSTAARLLHHYSGISGLRRAQLETMMEAELDRLTRLMSGRPTTAPGPVDVDSALEPVVVRHRAQGDRISWEPSRAQVLGRADDLAEIVSILLTNAQRHAANAPVRLLVRETRGSVEIVVSDSGPGIDRNLQQRIFEWGRHGSSSDGDGIGLASARLLSIDLNGYLRLDDRDDGATFILGLPTVEGGLRDRARTA